MGTTDKMKNNVQDASGKVQEKVGEWTGDESMRQEGVADQAKASAKKAGEKVKDAAGDVADAVRDAVKK